VSSRNVRIPRLCNWCAAENIGEDTSQAVSHGDKHNGPDGHVEVPARENTKVEYKDGTFGEARRGAVNYGGDEVHLYEFGIS
jgi:hypothetical protein